MCYNVKLSSTLKLFGVVLLGEIFSVLVLLIFFSETENQLTFSRVSGCITLNTHQRATVNYRVLVAEI